VWTSDLDVDDGREELEGQYVIGDAGNEIDVDIVRDAGIEDVGSADGTQVVGGRVSIPKTVSQYASCTFPTWSSF
jgi:hypothetical protein